MADVILETRNLTKEFKGFTAVNDANLRVQRGHIHALIGPNGAGKTTCFNLLTKFLVPTSGQILFDGRDITKAKPAQIARISIIRSFQISASTPDCPAERAHRPSTRSRHEFPVLAQRAIARPAQ